MMKFNRASLEAEGFAEWLTFSEARASGAIPVTGGVYVVLYPGRPPVAFLSSNPGGRFKGRDPSVSAEALAANWHDAEVVYIGNADQLRRRIRQFADFGAARMPGSTGSMIPQADVSIPASAGKLDINSRYRFTGIPLAFWRKSGLCGIPRRAFTAQNSRFPVKFPSERERPTRERFAGDCLHRQFASARSRKRP